MERPMPSNPKLELISQTIQKLVEEDKRAKFPASGAVDLVDDDVDDQILISKYLSQLQLEKGEGDVNPSEASTEADGTPPAETNKTNVRTESSGGKEISTDDIVKELREVKRQNTITHVLLSVMIALTLTWQLSEVTLILKIKDRLGHPFRSFGSALAGMFKRPAAATDDQDAENQST